MTIVEIPLFAHELQGLECLREVARVLYPS